MSEQTEITKYKAWLMDGVIAKLDAHKVPTAEELTEDFNKVLFSKSFWKSTAVSALSMVFFFVVLSGISFLLWLGVELDFFLEALIVVCAAMLHLIPLFWLNKTNKISKAKKEVQDLICSILVEPVFNSIQAHNKRIEQVKAYLNMQYALHDYSDGTKQLISKIEQALPAFEKNRDNLLRIQSRYPALRNAQKSAIGSLELNLQSNFLNSEDDQELDQLAMEIDAHTQLQLNT